MRLILFVEATYRHDEDRSGGFHTLTGQEYAETSEYLIVDDQIGDKGIS